MNPWEEQPVDPIAFTKVRLSWGWMSNMSPHPIRAGDKTWRTAEAYFQSLRFAHDDPARELIRLALSPMEAKMIARGRASKMIIVRRSTADVANMWTTLGLKAEQHPNLTTELIDSGDRVIIEDSSGRDLFWGAGLAASGWVGENRLGKMWMDLRSELRKARTPS